MKCTALILLSVVLSFSACVYVAQFPTPYREIVAESFLPSDLVYSVMKTESGFRPRLVSKRGAVGIMQILPSTAQYVCELTGREFDAERLTEGEYNVRLGICYLEYLNGKFSERTALAAYNAGEGTVSEWLKDKRYSDDGEELTLIPYRETEDYLKKINFFRKFYKKRV